MPLILLLSAIALTSCGAATHTDSLAMNQKVAGPSLKTLSHDELMDVLHECHRYGPSDDSRVRYTTEYCSSAQSVHAMEGYATPSSAAVDPTINKLH